jgi:hypothetical protein
MEEYLVNLKALGRIYRDVFGAHYPAMALVQVVRLVEKAARVEIEATAVVPRCRGFSNPQRLQFCQSLVSRSRIPKQ